MYARSPDEQPPANARHPMSLQLYPYHQQAFHHPQRPPPPDVHQPRPLYTALPSNPPNHAGYSAAAATAIGLSLLSLDPPTTPTPPPPVAMPQPPDEPPASPVVDDDDDDDDDDIDLALAISQSELFQKQQEDLKLKISSQEDEDLAKALAESLQTAVPPPPPIAPAPSTHSDLDRSDSLPKYQRLYTTQTDRLSSSIAAMESLQQTESDESRLVFDDAAYARQIAADEEDVLRRRIEEKGRLEAERQAQLDRQRQQEAEAEAERHRHAAEAERQQQEEAERHRQAGEAVRRRQQLQQAEPEMLPQYTSDGLLTPNTQVPDSTQPAMETPPPPPLSVASSSSSPSASPSRPRAVSEAVRHHSSLPFPLNQPNYDPRPQMPTLQSAPPAPADNLSAPYGNRLSSHSFPSAAAAGPSSDAAQHRFIDRQLLTGVSIGFKPPVLSTRLVPMEDPMPNIISLPATKCPPLHLQAPSWRQLLCLLARLGSSRIEATVEALSTTKAELKLRTVVQFVKAHPYGDSWRTILWFTVDHPVPPNAPGAGRYLSGNPNLLPWSYTLSPVPVLLRDAAETSMSKTYTIPATEAVPLPTLPITFPNLAHYLQAALEESRRNSRSSDSSSGLGKLGKMALMCYPNVKEDVYGDDWSGKSSGVADLWKRVIKRGNKDKKKGKSNNEETYTMFTPFVNNEWG